MKNKGFTLLEVLIVIGIMGLVAAMVWPVRAVLDDSQRRRVTHEHIDAIREAILGHSQALDRLDMGRIISGYVGDMEDWPDLWEPAGSGLGGDRGEFVGDVFRFSGPFDEVGNPTAESLGQPRGLWTRYVSNENDPDFNLDQDTWRGPYLTPPVARNTAAGSQYATTTAEYQALVDEDRAYFHLLQGDGQLLDGWNRAFRFFISEDPDKQNSDPDEIFWIVSLGADGRGDFPEDMADYYDDEHDPNYNSPANRDNIVIQLKKSEWKSIFQNQHLRSSITRRLILYTEDEIDRIARALIGDAPAGPNTGYTGDLLGWPDMWNWVCRFEEEAPGDPGPVPCGTCRDLEGETVPCDTEGAVEATGAWESEWIGDFIDPDKAYTFGQPRGLWDQGDLPFSEFGVGWRHAYIESPRGRDSQEVLLDAWERPYHFFKVQDNGKTHFMIVSGGPSGSGVFHDASSDGDDFDFIFPQPEYIVVPETEFDDYLKKRAATFNLASYQPSFRGEIDEVTYDNTDNIVRLVRQEEWDRGFFTVHNLWIDNLEYHSGTDTLDDVRCRLYGVLDAGGEAYDLMDPVESVEVFCGGRGSATGNPNEYACTQPNSGVLVEQAGTYSWLVGYGYSTTTGYVNNDGGHVFRYTKEDDDAIPDSKLGTIATGGRYLICTFNDTVAGVERRWEKIIPVFGHPAKKAEIRDLYLDKEQFRPVP